MLRRRLLADILGVVVSGVGIQIGGGVHVGCVLEDALLAIFAVLRTERVIHRLRSGHVCDVLQLPMLHAERLFGRVQRAVVFIIRANRDIIKTTIGEYSSYSSGFSAILRSGVSEGLRFFRLLLGRAWVRSCQRASGRGLLLIADS